MAIFNAINQVAVTMRRQTFLLGMTSEVDTGQGPVSRPGGLPQLRSFRFRLFQTTKKPYVVEVSAPGASQTLGEASVGQGEAGPADGL